VGGGEERGGWEMELRVGGDGGGGRRRRR